MSKKKHQQLGMNAGTASGRLSRMLLFRFVQDAGQDVCFQCACKIESIEDFSIEHKKPWLDSDDPAGVFFDLDNIAYSHKRCNFAASRTNKKYSSREERMAARRASNRKSWRKHYSTEWRRAKYKRNGS
jgi:hypothetical protein